jgi:hypothetical protein
MTDCIRADPCQGGYARASGLAGALNDTAETLAKQKPRHDAGARVGESGIATFIGAPLSLKHQAIVLELRDRESLSVRHQLEWLHLGDRRRDNARVSGRGSSPSDNAGDDQNGSGSEPIDFAHRTLLLNRFSVTEAITLRLFGFAAMSLAADLVSFVSCQRARATLAGRAESSPAVR